MKGKFIVFEGIDGAGKTTQARLLEDALRKRGIDAVRIREPGATPAGEKIRDLLLDPSSALNMRCELFLYMAARAQLVQERIVPLVKSGRWVIGDRYLYSSAAYQGEAGGLGMARVMQIGELAIEGAVPDLVFLMDMDPAKAARRTAQRKADRIEKRGLWYQNKVRRGFRKLRRWLGRKLVILDAAKPPEEVHRDVLRFLRLP